MSNLFKFKKLKKTDDSNDTMSENLLWAILKVAFGSLLCFAILAWALEKRVLRSVSSAAVLCLRPCLVWKKMKC